MFRYNSYLQSSHLWLPTFVDLCRYVIVTLCILTSEESGSHILTWAHPKMPDTYLEPVAHRF